MDISAGLVALVHAVGIAKDLRDIERGVDEASFKLKLAELIEALAESKIALSEAKQGLRDRDERIVELERSLAAATSGEGCPICGKGRLKVTAVRAHPTFGEAGIQERDLQCSNPDCHHRERRMFDPNGMLKR